MEKNLQHPLINIYHHYHYEYLRVMVLTNRSANPALHRSFGLDFVRTLAISLVLVAHFAKKLEHFGFWGVELFFGLSGFLIGQILWRSYSGAGRWSFKHMLNFWSRRWWRTLPDYYLFLIIMLFFHHYNGDDLPSISLFLKHLFFLQDFLSRNGSFFGVAWSLCIEEWFYLLFPLILFFIGLTGARPKAAFIISLLLIFITSAVVREILIREHVGHSLRGITLARIDAIACGVAVAFWLSTEKVTLKKRWTAFFIGVVLFLLSFITVYFSGLSYNEIKESRYLLVSVSLGFSLMLPLVSLLSTPKGIFKPFSRAVESMSLWSYSLYLSHIPVMFIVYKLMDSFRDNNLNNLISKIVGLVITIIISAFIFNVFEVPFTRKRPRELKS